MARRAGKSKKNAPGIAFSAKIEFSCRFLGPPGVQNGAQNRFKNQSRNQKWDFGLPRGSQEAPEVILGPFWVYFGALSGAILGAFWGPNCWKELQMLLSVLLSAAALCCCSLLLSAAVCCSLCCSLWCSLLLSLLLSAAVCCSLIFPCFLLLFFRFKLDIHMLASHSSDALSVSPLGQV